MVQISDQESEMLVTMTDAYGVFLVLKNEWLKARELKDIQALADIPPRMERARLLHAGCAAEIAKLRMMGGERCNSLLVEGGRT